MCKYMTKVSEDNGLIGMEQFGFRRGRSTLDAIFTLMSLIMKAKSKGWHFASAFLDISKVIIKTYSVKSNILIIMSSGL